MTKSIFFPLGTTGNSVATCMLSNNVSNGKNNSSVRTFAIISDDPQLHHHLPKSSLGQGNNIDYYKMNIPENDIGTHLLNGELKHLDFNPHGFWNRSSSDSGMALRPAYGYLAAVMHRDKIKSLIKDGIGDQLNARHGEEGKLNIITCSAACGGTGSGSYPQVMEILKEIRSDVGEGLCKIWEFVFIIAPNYHTESQLSVKHLGNTAGFLSKQAAMQMNCLRYRKINQEGESDETWEPQNPISFVLSDINENIFKPEDLIANTSKIIEWFSASPLGDAWKAKYVDIEANIKKDGDPLVNRIGASSIYYAKEESVRYFTAKLKAHLIEEMLKPLENSPQKALEELIGAKLLEDHIKPFISNRLAMFKSTDVYHMVDNFIEQFHPKAKKLSLQLDRTREFFDTTLPEGMNPIFKHIKDRTRDLSLEAKTRPKHIVNAILESGDIGQAVSVAYALKSTLNDCLEKIKKKISKDTESETIYKQRAEDILQKGKKYSGKPFQKRIFQSRKGNSFLKTYTSYRAEANKIAIRKALKDGSRKVIRAFLKELEVNIGELNKIESHLKPLSEEAQGLSWDFENSQYTHRGLGIDFDGIRSNENHSMFKDLSDRFQKTNIQALSKKLSDVFLGIGKYENIQNVIDDIAEKTLSDLISDIKRVDIAFILSRDPEKDEIIKRAIRQAKETTPVDEVSGAGKHINLVGIYGGSSSPLCADIARIAKTAKVVGGFEFVDIKDQSQVLFMRSEIGRKLSSLKIIKPCYEAYEKLGDDRYYCHIEPLWALLPTLPNRTDMEEVLKFFAYGLMTESIKQDGTGEFYQELLEGENLPIGSPLNEDMMQMWAKKYPAKIESVSRYIHMIKRKGFESVEAIIQDFKAKYKNEQWADVFDSILKEHEYIAKLYHQKI